MGAERDPIGASDYSTSRKGVAFSGQFASACPGMPAATGGVVHDIFDNKENKK